jgi:hypothetical protein
MHHLTVVRDFAGYSRGDHIEDAAEVARLLKSEHANHVVKVIADEKPKDEPKAATAQAESKAAAAD